MLILFSMLFFLSENLEKVHDIKGVKKGFVLAIPLLLLCIASFISGRTIKGNLKTIKKVYDNLLDRNVHQRHFRRIHKQETDPSVGGNEHSGNSDWRIIARA